MLLRAANCLPACLPACLSACLPILRPPACLVSRLALANGSALLHSPASRLCTNPLLLPLTCTLCFAGSPALPQARHQTLAQALPLPNQRPQANHQRHRSTGRLRNTSTVRTCNAKTPNDCTRLCHPSLHPTGQPAAGWLASHTSAFSSPTAHLFPRIISPAQWGQGCLGPCPCRSLRMPRCVLTSVSPRPYNT